LDILDIADPLNHSENILPEILVYVNKKFA